MRFQGRDPQGARRPRGPVGCSELVAAGIPVVTLVTDLPTSPRSAYVGIDNRAAGAMAAYLTEQWMGERPDNVLVTLSSGSFRGEEEREMVSGSRCACLLRAVVWSI